VIADIAPVTGLPADFLGRVAWIAALVRDLGVILGIPAVLAVGLKLYDLQTKALEAQVKATESQVKAVEAQNALLKETQYDRAISLLKSQKELFENERSSLEQQVAGLTVSGKDQSDQIAALANRIFALDIHLRGLVSRHEQLYEEYERKMFNDQIGESEKRLAELTASGEGQAREAWRHNVMIDALTLVRERWRESHPKE
jgi:chromosome segregation ATPase